MNKYKKTKTNHSKPKKGKSLFRKFASSVNVIGLINKNMIVALMPYAFFLTLLSLIYIANSYYAERTIREIDSLNKELKELRSEYISGKSELMFSSKQSHVAAKAEELNIKESLVPPKKIVISAYELKENKEIIDR